MSRRRDRLANIRRHTAGSRTFHEGMYRNRRRRGVLGFARQAAQYLPHAIPVGQAWWQRRHDRKAKANAQNLQVAKIKSKPIIYKPMYPQISKSYLLKTTRRNQYKIKRLMRGQAGKELKTHDLSLTPAPSSTGTFDLLNGIQQGDTSKQREGLKIAIQSININLRMRTSTHADFDKSTVVRVIIIKDRQNQGVVPTSTLILESNAVFAHKEHDEKHRFQFLFDKKFVITRNLTNTVKTRMLKYYKRFKKPITAWYTGTGGTQADVNKNSLYMFILTDQTQSLDVDGACRIRFTD